MQMDLPEEQKMWEERKALVETKDETTDPFIPAKEARMDKDSAVVYIEL